MNKAVPTQGIRHLLISEGKPLSPNPCIRELWLNRFPFCLRSRGLVRHVSAPRAQTRLMSPSWGCFKSSVLRSSVTCFAKPGVQAWQLLRAAQTHKQTDISLHNSSPEQPPQLCAQGGLRCSSSPPRLIRSQLGRSQRCTARSSHQPPPGCSRKE